MYGATNRAFLYYGYAGYANDGNYGIGHNNWDDQNNNWKSWLSNWEKYYHSDYSAYLTLRKIGDKLYFYINGEQIKEFNVTNFYGSKIGFGVNEATRSFISNLTVKKLNLLPKTKFREGEIYYCWVNELNVRSGSNMQNNIITTLNAGDPVEFLGESGQKEIEATFRDFKRTDYFYKVKLLDGTIGWVHGGALQEIDSEQSVFLKNFKIPH